MDSLCNLVKSKKYLHTSHVDQDERPVPVEEQGMQNLVLQQRRRRQRLECVDDVHVDVRAHDGGDATGGVEALRVLQECTGVLCWTAGPFLLLVNVILHPTKRKEGLYLLD